ncbi:MAG: response regulator, partial [Syntrophales bacterium]|nr:response regulator [Syntrophales bacterium]
MSLKILVVDDEEDIVNLLSYNLEKEGYLVLKAYNGREALRMVKKDMPDLVILDLMLPEMPGIDVARSIRSNPATARLPIIMLTAKGGELDRVLGLEM